MRTFIIIIILLCTSNVESKAIYTGRFQDVLSQLQSLYVYKYMSYGYGDDDNNNNYNNDDNNDDNYNNNNDDNYNGGDDDNYNNNNDDNYNGGDDDDSSEIPLDGGLSFLAVAGAGLGIKKLRDNRAKKKAEHNE